MERYRANNLASWAKSLQDIRNVRLRDYDDNETIRRMLRIDANFAKAVEEFIEELGPELKEGVD